MKKRINIVLLLFVLGLWSTIIYRYVNQFFLKNDIAFHENVTINMKKFNSKGKDTFELKTIIRDPFINKVSSNKENYKTTLVRSNLIKKVNNNRPIGSTQFPMINYLGYIKSSNNKNELVLIKVNNKLFKYRFNEMKEGIKVININKDSIQILFQNMKKYFKRNK